MMKILSLVMTAAWLVGQVSAVSSSDDPLFLSKTDSNNEDNNIMITGGLVELRRVIIMHRSGNTATTKKKSAGSSEASWPVFPTTSNKTTSMVVDGDDNDTDHHQQHQQQHDWVLQPPLPPAQKEQRQLQTRHEQACDLLYDLLIVENPGASCECKRGAATFTCVHPPTCVDEQFTTCVGGGGEICGIVTRIYGYYIEGTTVIVDTERTVTQYTSGGGSLRGKEVQVIGKDQCYYFMTTLDGLRYQCNDCSSFDCPDGESNVDCSNIQADSTTRGQCVSINTTADLGLLNNYCVEGPIVPTTLPVPSAAGLWHKNVLLATTAMLICSLLMI